MIQTTNQSFLGKSIPWALSSAKERTQLDAHVAFLPEIAPLRGWGNLHYSKIRRQIIPQFAKFYDLVGIRKT